jgi:hypothetical protein
MSHFSHYVELDITAEANTNPSGVRQAAEGPSLFVVQLWLSFLYSGAGRATFGTSKNEGFAPLDSKKILEVGCGTGYWLREVMKGGITICCSI